jgi:hypothetical protein
MHWGLVFDFFGSLDREVALGCQRQRQCGNQIDQEVPAAGRATVWSVR